MGIQDRKNIQWNFSIPKVSCLEGCPHFRGYQGSMFGTSQSALNIEVSSIQGSRVEGVPL